MTSNTPEQLPTSVRGAPAELRRLIRKRQNSESAKRCRLRRKMELANEQGSQVSTYQKMAQLEALVAQLAQGLAQTQSALAALIPPPVIPSINLPSTHFTSSTPSSPITPNGDGVSLQLPPVTPMQGIDMSTLNDLDLAIAE